MQEMEIWKNRRKEKMKTITRNYNVYKYAELSEQAKDKVRTDYLIDYSEENVSFFHDTAIEYLKAKYPNSDLNIEFDFSGCQSSGLNIYGTFNLIDFDYTGKDDFTWFLNFVSGEIELRSNKGSYTYSLKDIDESKIYHALCAEYEDALDNIYIGLTDDGRGQIERLTKMVLAKLKEVENNLYVQGENMVNYISDESMMETSEVNEWYYFKNGELFVG